MHRRGEQYPDNGFEAWGGYMNAKIAKLEEQFSNKAAKDGVRLSDIFNGVSIYVNGYTDPSADDLKALMYHHGGIYHTYQRSEDFVIASNLPDTKVKNMSLAKIVKPEWITNSIASNRLLDYRDYLLYKNSKSQPQLSFMKSNIKQDTKLVALDRSDVLGLIKTKENNSIVHTVETVELKKHDTVTKTAADPDFISEFFSNSRLHHISQLGACFKQYVNDLRENSNFDFPARSRLKEKIFALSKTSNFSQISFEKGKTIMHIDMDCFFVSVGLRTRPHLKGLPVAVTHSKGGQTRTKRDGVDRNTEFNLYKQKQAQKICKATGQIVQNVDFESRVDNITDEDDKYGSMSEIASCSYEARSKGLRNGMFMGAALRLCPDLQTIPYDFDGYKEVAYTLYNTLAEYTLDIEAVSCDEMYVDCTELLKDMNAHVQSFATVLREEIKNRTGCPCSTGFGGNRLQARLATKHAKPDGQFFLSADLVEDFMINIKLKDLPGVGRQTMMKLESLGHNTCGSLQNLSLATLKVNLGIKTGAQLFDQCRGRDNHPLRFHSVRKSVSAEVNYGIRFDNNNQCIVFLKQLSREVHSRMVQFKVIGKCITLKLMVRAEDAPVETAKFMGHGFCNVINKSIILNSATNDVDVISNEIIGIYKKQNLDPKELRGIGIQITKLESTVLRSKTGAISKYFCDNNMKQTTERIASVNERHTTPKKVKNEILPRKSPIIGYKSPTKRRGRPPKALKSHPPISKKLISKFLEGQNHSCNSQYKDPFTNQVPMVKPLENPQPTTGNEVKSQGLLSLSWEKIRELLRAWLESGQTPLALDVRLIINYMSEMVINKKIDKLYILLNFLRRRTREINNVDWIKVYNQIIEHVQNAMIAVYGKKLMISE